jgi:anti-anti-sigma factor
VAAAPLFSQIFSADGSLYSLTMACWKVKIELAERAARADMFQINDDRRSMAAQQNSFHYEVETSELKDSDVLDSRGNKVTTIKCHGKLVAENRGQIEEMFKDTPFTGRIVIDLSDVNYIDSAGLGALIRLKMSAIKQGSVSVEFVQMTPRVMELLRLTKMADWFTS